MDTRKYPYRARMQRLAIHALGYVVFLAPVALAACLYIHASLIPKTAVVDGSAPSASDILPHVLSKADITYYATIFSAQKRADWAEADRAAEQLENPILLGYVLADRYQERYYPFSREELVSWLRRYSDHPQAPDIYTLAVRKWPELKDELPLIVKQTVLRGMGDDNGFQALHSNDAAYASQWQEALQAWKLHRYGEAAKQFSAIASHPEHLSPWMVSAANYWSYRCYAILSRSQEASGYLAMAALHPRSFYGILARKQLEQPLEVDREPITLTDGDMLEMIGDQPIRRIIALSQAGMRDLADQELRLRFSSADTREKTRLLALARELGLASVQISIARHLDGSGHALDFARYPLPDWRPDGGFRIDPLLIYALVRQESGFQPSAKSTGGAVGLMQLMPETAHLMQKKNPARNAVMLASRDAADADMFEPVLNVTLGQHYVEHLLRTNLVGGNLIYLLAAYNAGPSRLQNWKAHLEQDDPLLFVETIPYAQTRHYVMQVMTNYWMYSELAGVSNPSVHALAQGQWPTYVDYERPIATTSGLIIGKDGA